MKLLYIVPQIKCAGGVARVLSVKANYFVEKWGWQLHILSQNEQELEPFYHFNERVVFHHMKLEGNAISFLYSLYKEVNLKIKDIAPDLILIADNGIKGFLYPFILKTNTPLILECHASRFVEDRDPGFFSHSKLKYWFKKFAATRFSFVVLLSQESLKEWDLKKAGVIANPKWITAKSRAALTAPRALVIARNSYEKGLDRLLPLWQKIHEAYPEWNLDLYTDKPLELQKMANELGITSGVHISAFVKDIGEKYLQASLLLMGSRTEAFPMVLVEAMSLGVPAVAYDCPIGPRAVIIDGYNGFLVADGQGDLFVEKVALLIDNLELRRQMGAQAQIVADRFQLEKIMEEWRLLLTRLSCH